MTDQRPRSKRRPKLDDTTATMRRIAMLQMIPNEPRSVSTADIHRRLEAAGFNVDRRTVQRDLASFSAVFHYTSEERGRPLVWFWPKGCAEVSIRTISPEAALVLSIAERELQGLLPAAALTLLEPYFKRASETLSLEHAATLGSWKDKLRVIPRGPSFVAPKVSAEVQMVIFNALLEGKQIQARYRKRGQAQAKEMTLNPLGIVSRQAVIYLVATAWKYEDPFLFALHRFDRAEITAEECVVPEDFDLDYYIENERGLDFPTGAGKIKLKLEATPEAAVGLLERPLSENQKVREIADSRFRIEAEVEDTLELRWWILGMGSSLKVLGPVALQREIFNEIKMCGSAYGLST